MDIFHKKFMEYHSVIKLPNDAFKRLILALNKIPLLGRGFNFRKEYRLNPYCALENLL